MHRRRKYGVEEAMQSYPVIVNIFDVLYNDAKSVTGYPYRKRRRILTELVEIGDLSDDDGASRDKAAPILRKKEQATEGETETVENWDLVREEQAMNWKESE